STKNIKKTGKHGKTKGVENKKTSIKEKQNIDSDYLSKEHLNLDIPVVPEAPKNKKNLTFDTSKISKDVLERMKRFESADVKVVLVNCERCEAVIPVPVPKKAVLDSDLPVVPISYVHKNLQNKDQHCLTIHLDHDFDIRRQRLSDVVIADD
ncbi:MAG: hypothetical protein R3255_04615, partial [Candidatus Lokiarchaeia archaeon]|nr:hypothetical protein [Candidatus Lokiarchaeia archaeon]